MSHIVTIRALIKDPVALAAACRRLGLQEPVHGTVQMYSGEATGLIVRLPGWRYPVVVDTTKAELHFDNFAGAWGEQSQLDRLIQAYAVEKTRLESRKAGHTMTEQALPDGSIKLVIQTGGAAL
jgi:GAF domain-containing protein